MISLEYNSLVFRFPEVHPDAELSINFQRTLRVPDDGTTYPLPAGIGSFPLRHLEDFKENLPASWHERGGVLLPMYQSEALWINFDTDYPMAIKIAAGKINAVTGKSWSNDLHVKPQDYLAVPLQPWLDGFKTKGDLVNQFVAAQLGQGVTAEEQITGSAEFGGLQIIVYPLKKEIYEAEQARVKAMELDCLEMPMFCMSESRSESMGMGLGLGGAIKQKIYTDDRPLSDYADTSSRCFVHLVNSHVWQSVTNEPLPHPPISRTDYETHGIPWYEIYDDNASAVPASDVLGGLKTISQFAINKELDNTPISVSKPIKLGNVKIVDEGKF